MGPLFCSWQKPINRSRATRAPKSAGQFPALYRALCEGKQVLSIVGHADCKRVDAEFSDYVPFAFRLEHAEERPHIYWRTGNMQSTLLEVEISPVDGRIVGASLLLAGEVAKGMPDLTLPLNASVGVPIVATSGWSAGVSFDDPAPICVFVEGSNLLIRFSLDEAAQSIKLRGIMIGVAADSSLVWIFVTGLSSDEIAKLAQ